VDPAQVVRQEAAVEARVDRAAAEWADRAQVDQARVVQAEAVVEAAAARAEALVVRAVARLVVVQVDRAAAAPEAPADLETVAAARAHARTLAEKPTVTRTSADRAVEAEAETPADRPAVQVAAQVVAAVEAQVDRAAVEWAARAQPAVHPAGRAARAPAREATPVVVVRLAGRPAVHPAEARDEADLVSLPSCNKWKGTLASSVPFRFLVLIEVTSGLAPSAWNVLGRPDSADCS
jgi:hypothetical protein